MITLNATETASATEMVVNLEVWNGTNEAVYVPVLPVDAEFATYPNSAYVHLTTDGLGVCLVLGPSLLPTDADVEVLMAAYSTTLPAGGRLRHTLRLPLPLHEWYAYQLPVPESEAPEPVLVYQVHVFLDVVPRSRARFVGPAPGNEQFIKLTGKDPELLRCTLTPDHPVPVFKCTDPGFPRL